LDFERVKFGTLRRLPSSSHRWQFCALLERHTKFWLFLFWRGDAEDAETQRTTPLVMYPRFPVLWPATSESITSGLRATD